MQTEEVILESIALQIEGNTRALNGQHCVYDPLYFSMAEKQLSQNSLFISFHEGQPVFMTIAMGATCLRNAICP